MLRIYWLLGGVLATCPLIAQAQAPPGPGAAAPVTPAGEPPVAAEPEIPDRRLVLSNLLVFRLNPIGLEDQLRFGYQHRLSHRPGALFRDTFLFVGLAPKLNPAFVKIGPSIELQPLSIFNLRVAAEYMGFFGSVGYMQSFASPLDDYSDSTMSCAGLLALHKLPQDQCTTQSRYGASGAHVMIEPLLQFKFGPVVLRNKFAAEYWYMGVRAGDRVFYEATLDTLVPANGWVITDDLDLLFVTRFRLTLGARYSVVQPFYQASDYRSGEDTTQNDNGHQRLGLLLAYTFFDRGFTRFNKPTLVLITSWYLTHRYRTGADVSQGVPYLVLGFGFQSDLLNSGTLRR